VLFGRQAFSYGLVEEMACRIASGLRKGGICPGDRVGLFCINSHWFVAAYFGILKAGACAVPIHLLLSAEEIGFILKDAGCRGLVTYGALEGCLDGISSLVSSIPCRIVVGEGKIPGARSLDDVIAHEAPDPGIPALNQKEDVAVILYTSGTTGVPKGAMLTHRNLLANVDSILATVPFVETDIILTVLPMFHAFAATACILTPIAVGATIVAVPKFTAEEVIAEIERNSATVFLGVPSMFAVLASVPEDRRANLSSLRFCVSGGAALPAEVMERFEKRFGVLIYEGDGPTECSPVTSVNPIGGRRKVCSIGLPLPGVRMRIVDDRGQTLPTGSIGEIVVAGENVMKGYLNRPEETKEAFFGEWFRTGDLGYVDEDGYFFIVDRKKDMIIVNGMNVYPRMVEEVLCRHPAVAEVAVVPEPHKLHGEVPRAVIALKEGCSVGKAEILAFCRQHLGRHEVPRVIEFVPSLPKTPTGKINKRAIARKVSQAYGQ